MQLTPKLVTRNAIRTPRPAGPPWVRPLALVAGIIWMESVLRVQIDGAFFGVGLVISVLVAITAGLAIHLASTFLRPVGRTVVASVGLAMVTLLYLSQFVYFQIFRTFFTAYSAANAGQVTEFAADIVAAIGENAPVLAIIALPPALGLVAASRLAPPPKPTKRHRVIVAVALVLCHVSALTLVNLGDREPNSPHDLYYRSSYPVASVERLGLLTTMRLDVLRTIFGFEPAEAASLPTDAPGADPGAEEPAVPADASGSAAPPEPVKTSAATPKPAALGYNSLNIDFAQLAAGTTDKTLKSAHTYFGGRAPTAKNDHTGQFKGYNLIFITAEGYSHYAVDPKITPTLYKMTHQGVNFTNFYNPIWGVSTSDGEYVATTGLIPKAGVWSMSRSGTNAMPYAMGNQLKPLGYKTMAYHNHTYSFYDRDTSHPNLGYTYKGVGNGLQVKKTWPESDIEMVSATVDEYVGKEPFHTYYMTVSGHLRYSFGGNFIAAKNRDLVTGLPYLEAGRAYLATQIELDRALELLLAELNEAGVADRTLIALSADHYPYGLEKAEIDNLAGHTVEPNFELYKSSFLLYAQGMKPETVDRPVSSLDIIPTLSNLMGTNFDSRLLMGVDAFSDADPLVIFNNRSFISDKGRYNAQTRQFTPEPGAAAAEDYRKMISADIDQKFYYSRVILDTNYYAIAKPR